MKPKPTYDYLDRMLANAFQMDIAPEGKWVIFSDLHMGDGGSTDDFAYNAEVFQSVLRDYYLPRGYGLILNGDVEELQRFTLKKIQQKWAPVYELFAEFAYRDKFFKTLGNHDMGLVHEESYVLPCDFHQALTLNYKGNQLFVFHGHQASKSYQHSNELIGMTLRYVANPLGIKNYSVAHSSKKQYSIEKKVYRYSVYNRIVSVIGHTHRPLFETPMTRLERLHFKIENLFREYLNNPEADLEFLEEKIEKCKKSLRKLRKKENLKPERPNVYSSVLRIPCLFNAGCIIGRRGFTGLEIEDGYLSLVHWYDDRVHPRDLLHHPEREPERLNGNGIYRMELDREQLSYIFTRVRLLA